MADASVFIPEIWAQEALAILREKLIIGNLVHRDYSRELVRYGDTVNVQLPGDLDVNEKAVTGNVTVQEVTATNVPIVMNQHPEVTFIIEDVHSDLSMLGLFEIYLKPAIEKLARHIDLICMTQYGQFLANQTGVAGAFSKTNAASQIIQARKIMNNNFAPESPRNMIWNPSSEATALEVEGFISAEKVGDQGTALREASLGRLYGFNHWMSQNAPSITGAVDEVTGAINNAAGELKGDTALTVDGFTGALTAGAFIKIAGNGVYRIVSTAETTGNTTTINIDRGLIADVADNAVVTVSDAGAVNYGSGYAAGYIGDIVYDGFTNTPVVGQLVSFGNSATNAVYGVVKVGANKIKLDRPLEAAVADNATIHVSPNVDVNFGLTGNAIALVSRTLGIPRSGTGTTGAIISDPELKLGLRVLISYDSDRLGTKITVDMLCGIKTLRQELGVVMIS